MAVTTRMLDSPASPSEARPGSIAAPEAEQAAWKIRARPMGARGKPSRREHNRADDAGRRVGAVIKEIYGALFLEPAGLRTAVRSNFDRSAGTALLTTRSGLPRSAQNVRTTARRAEISVQVPRTRYAVAEVRVVAKGVARNAPQSRFRVVHHSTLYLEKVRSGWKVIAFELDQGRGK